MAIRKQINQITNILEETKKELVIYGANQWEEKTSLLILEELLLLYSGTVDPQTEIFVDIIRTPIEFGMKCYVPGTQLPFSELEKKQEVKILDNLLNYSGYHMEYSYDNGNNVISIRMAEYDSLIKKIKYIIGFLGKKRRTFRLGFVSHILSMIVSLMIPFFTGKLVTAYMNNLFLQIIAISLSLFVANAIHHITIRYSGYMYDVATFEIRNNLTVTMMSNMFKIKEQVLEQMGTGTFTQRIVEDTKTVSTGLMGLSSMISNGMYYIGVLLATFMMNKIAFFAEVVCLFVLFLMEKRRIAVMDKDKRRAVAYMDSTTTMTNDMIKGSIEVKSLNAEKSVENRMTKRLSEQIKLLNLVDIHDKTRLAASGVVVSFFQCLIMIYLGYSIYKGIELIPDVLVVFNYITIIGTPVIVMINNAVTNVKELSLACDRIIELNEGSLFKREVYGNCEPQETAEEICVKDVSFEYNYDNPTEHSKRVLNHINIQIPKGSVVAIVGKSASGKTTLMRLLARQEICTDGCVLIDGIDIKDLSKEAIGRKISIVNQSPYAFNMSIRDNLLMAKPDATMAELEDACEKACILEDIKKMQKSFDTLVGENGHCLSGGQRQRISIARAFLRDTDIMILDEATAALDNITQQKVMENITKSDTKKRTVIMVAHRMSTIMDVDTIYVLDDGRISDFGTHDELMRKSKIYRDLYATENEVKES